MACEREWEWERVRKKFDDFLRRQIRVVGREIRGDENFTGKFVLVEYLTSKQANVHGDDDDLTVC